MAVAKRVACLVNSREDSSRCIAGKERPGDISSTCWIGPVSIDSDGALSGLERCYENCYEPQPLTHNSVKRKLLRRSKLTRGAHAWLLK